jgi:arylsulfatase A-like enzyme
VAQAVCSASRAALLTGCYPNRVGILGALGPNTTHGIHDRETTLGELLKQKGYATAIFGKWHLGHHPQFLPTRHGFDEYFGLPYSNDMWPKHPTAKFPALPLIRGEETVETNPDQTRLTTWYTEHVVRFIEKNQDRPFFVYVPHAMPHVPLFVSEKHRGKSAAGTFGDVIEEIDWSMGEILSTLKKHHLDDNTLVIFTSDNGPWLSYGNHAGTAGPLREGKGSVFDGGVRVPCVMRWPGRIPSGRDCREPVMTIDLLPTLASIIGADLPKHAIDGMNILPLLEGAPGARSPHVALHFFWGRQLQAIRSGNFKMHFAHTYRSLDGKQGGRDGKPAPYVEKKIGDSLFDLAADVGETTDVADKHPDIVKRMREYAATIRRDLGDPDTKTPGTGVRQPGQIAKPAK